MKHRTILLAAALGLLVTTAGCGMTTETLQQRTAEALAATPATSLEGEYGYTMTLEEPTTGVTMEVELSCAMEGTICARTADHIHEDGHGCHRHGDHRPGEHGGLRLWRAGGWPTPTWGMCGPNPTCLTPR